MRQKVTNYPNLYMLLLGLIIFFNTRGFYLFGTDFPSGDIALVLEAFFFAVVYFFNWGSEKHAFRFTMLIPILLALTSADAATLSYNQPFMLGFQPQRGWLGAMLMYFPLNKLYHHGKLKKENLFVLLDVMNVIFFVLIFAQFIAGSSAIILHATGANEEYAERYGSIRLYIRLAFILISYFYHLQNIFIKKNYHWFDWLFVVLTVVVYVFMIKARMNIVSLLGATFIVIISQKMSVKKLFIVVASFILIIAFLYSDVGKNILEMVNKTGEDEIQEDTSAIRDYGREFYLSFISENSFRTFWGAGYPNIDWEETVEVILYEEGVNMNDNGIFGILFMYGYSFVVWMVYLYLKLFVMCLRRKQKWMFAYFAFGIFGIYTLYPGCYYADIAFVLVMVLLENEKLQVRGPKKVVLFQPNYLKA